MNNQSELLENVDDPDTSLGSFHDIVIQFISIDCNEATGFAFLVRCLSLLEFEVVRTADDHVADITGENKDRKIDCCKHYYISNKIEYKT